MYISVIIPAYNGQNTIRQCIESILNSDWNQAEIEIIVVDDASTDDTPHVVEKLQVYHPNIKLIKHNKNRGAAACRTTGLQHARGEFLFVLSQDAFAHPEWIRKAVGAFAENQRVGIVQGRVELIGQISTPFYHATQVRKLNRHFPTVAIAYRAEAVDHAGRYFPVELSDLGDDTDLAWRIIRAGYAPTWIEAITAYHGVYPVRNGFRKNIEGAWRGPRSFALLIKRNPEMRKTFVIPFVWENPIRLFEFLTLLAALVILPFYPMAGIGLFIVSFFSCYYWMRDILKASRIPWIYRLLVLPANRYICNILHTISLWYGSLRYRTVVL